MLMMFLVSWLSIIASCSCIIVVRHNTRLIRETKMLYEAVNMLMLEAIWPPKGES